MCTVAMAPSTKSGLTFRPHLRAGKVFDPACGSGGSLPLAVDVIRSAEFTDRRHSLSFYGQEHIDTTLRLCRMNLTCTAWTPTSGWAIRCSTTGTPTLRQPLDRLRMTAQAGSAGRLRDHQWKMGNREMNYNQTEVEGLAELPRAITDRLLDATAHSVKPSRAQRSGIFAICRALTQVRDFDQALIAAEKAKNIAWDLIWEERVTYPSTWPPLTYIAADQAQVCTSIAAALAQAGKPDEALIAARMAGWRGLIVAGVILADDQGREQQASSFLHEALGVLEEARRDDSWMHSDEGRMAELQRQSIEELGKAVRAGRLDSALTIARSIVSWELEAYGTPLDTKDENQEEEQEAFTSALKTLVEWLDLRERIENQLYLGDEETVAFKTGILEKRYQEAVPKQLDQWTSPTTRFLYERSSEHPADYHYTSPYWKHPWTPDWRHFLSRALVLARLGRNEEAKEAMLETITRAREGWRYDDRYAQPLEMISDAVQEGDPDRALTIAKGMPAEFGNPAVESGDRERIRRALACAWAAIEKEFREESWWQARVGIEVIQAMSLVAVETGNQESATRILSRTLDIIELDITERIGDPEDEADVVEAILLALRRLNDRELLNRALAIMRKANQRVSGALRQHYDRVIGQSIAHVATRDPSYAVQALENTLQEASRRGRDAVFLHIAAFAPVLVALERVKPGIVRETWDRIQEVEWKGQVYVEPAKADSFAPAKPRPVPTNEGLEQQTLPRPEAQKANASPSAAQEERMIRCPNPDCGALNPAGHKFCGHCRTALYRSPQDREEGASKALRVQTNAGCLAAIIGVISFPLYFWLLGLATDYVKSDRGVLLLYLCMVVSLYGVVPAIVTGWMAYAILINRMARD